MEIRDIESFEQFQVVEAGSYRIVPEAYLEQLLKKVAQLEHLDINNDFNSLARLLKFSRSHIGLTQSQLAFRAELQPCQISDIENGKVKRPHKTTLDKISRVLGKSFEEGLKKVG